MEHHGGAGRGGGGLHVGWQREQRKMLRYDGFKKGIMEDVVQEEAVRMSSGLWQIVAAAPIWTQQGLNDTTCQNKHYA